MKIKSIELVDKKDLEIKWRITNSCNADCSYCIRKRYITKPEEIAIEQQNIEELTKYINALIEKHPEKNSIALMLIGGEVSIFDLKSILSKINRIDKLNIITNMLRNIDYYIDLADYCKSRDIFLSITCSFHEEFIDLDTFVDKLAKLKPHTGFIMAQMTSVAENQELVKTFIERLKTTDLDYIVDKDFRSIKNKEHLIGAAHKKDKPPKYKVTFEDDTVKYYTSRNQFLTDPEIDTNHTQKYFNANGYYCTHSYNFVYIDYDTVIGWDKDDYIDCKKHINIKDFDLIKAPRKCMTKGWGCTLCGNFELKGE